MTKRIWPVLAAVVSFSIAGCSKDDSTPSTPATSLSLNASAASVVANGVNTVTITVTDTSGSGPINLTTTRGTFSTGGTTATIAGASGVVTLVTCDATAVATCAGTAVVSAMGPSGANLVSITFGSLAGICPTNCSADPGCAARTCSLSGGGSGTCSATTPSTCVAAPSCIPLPAGATTETSCTDGVDNDCDGATDCEDSACADQACGGPTFLCKNDVCTDTTSGLAILVTPARARLPASAGAATTVTVTVTGDGSPVAGMSVTISASAGALSAATGTTGSDGTAAFTYTAPGTAGSATLTASLTAVPTVSRAVTLTFPVLGGFQIPSNPGSLQFPVMGAAGSGWNEFGWVQVQVLDDQGRPYPDGLPVRFEHRRLGGSTLGAPLTADTATCVAAAGCVGTLAAISSGAEEPDTTGLAAAWIYSGKIAGTLPITATATAGGVTRTVTLPAPAVVGARASGTSFSATCTRNVPALAETDCSISLVDEPFTCQAMLKDRFGNLLGTATPVIFVAEAAAVGKVATTPVYDPAQGPTGQEGLGIAGQIFNTLGGGLPFDVAPQAGEPSAVHALDGCGTRTHNPRDGVVTVLAIADGEEGLFDLNGNGSHDAGEPFTDQGEPFVDQDDDGVWSPGEWFLDVDGDGIYDLPNGAWDAAAKIWTQSVVVYTGPSATIPVGGNFLGTRWANAAGFTNACTATAAPAPFAVLAAVTGPPPAPPTSASYVVVASDMNLNHLHTGSSYEVAVQAGDVAVTYFGLPSYTDLHGLFYRYWPCDQLGNCAAQCRATGAAAPCEMVPSLSAFGCGVAAGVRVTGGSQPSAGGVLVDWIVDVPWEAYGSGRISTTIRTISGTSN